MIEIPLVGGQANAHQTLFVQIGDDLVEMQINWRTYTEEWVLDAYVEGDLCFAGVSLKPDCEITASYPDIDCKLFFIGIEPTLDNLGSDNHLVYYDE